ncbi:hypothetical protein diail_1575 [Diaporthe ilicicola]|nr:hypothetical protein diail_1575 [Diaporthe ilicicola]
MRLSAIPISLLAAAFPVSGLQTIQYGAFLPTATYSVANQLGFFTANGLNVVFNQVASSTDAFNSILSGQYDILTATVDNALNYRFNQNQNVTVLGQLDQGPDLVIASVPSITELSQLKGKPIIVDSPLSGYSYLLQYVLAKAGLTLANGDYSFMTVGGTSTRYAALLNGTLSNGTAVYASILNYPFTVESQSLPAGEAPNVLARISDYIAPITSSAFTVRESSLSNTTESALLTRFLASMYAANRFLLNPHNANCSVKAIAKQLNVTLDVAGQEYASVTDPVSGEISPGSDFTFNEEGLLNDVMVRSEFGGFSGLSDAFNFTEALEPGTGKLIDYSVRDAAVDLQSESRKHFQITKICFEFESHPVKSCAITRFETRRDMCVYKGKLSEEEVKLIDEDMRKKRNQYFDATNNGPLNGSYWTLRGLLEQYTEYWNNYVDNKLEGELRERLRQEEERNWEEHSNTHLVPAVPAMTTALRRVLTTTITTTTALRRVLTTAITTTALHHVLTTTITTTTALRRVLTTAITTTALRRVLTTTTDDITALRSVLIISNDTTAPRLDFILVQSESRCTGM